jgi:hypothetical protein
LGIARNTVRAALASDRPPKYERSSRGSLVDSVETDVRKLLADFPRMPATVIAERIGWEYSITTVKDRIRQIRPEYAGVDPADRIIYRPGEIVQCDSWFPEPRIPVGHGQNLMLPVLVMALGFSRFLTATRLPARQAGDLLAGMWQLINALGKVPKTLIWDRESAIGGKGVVTVPAASFAGTLATGSSWPRRGTRSSRAWWSATTGTSRPRSSAGTDVRVAGAVQHAACRLAAEGQRAPGAFHRMPARRGPGR